MCPGEGSQPNSGHRGRSGERGETLVEFAFASVIFFTMIFGAIEFGIGVWNYNLVSDLAQEGARYAMVHGQNSGAAKTEADVATFVQSRAMGLPVTTTTPLGPPSGKTSGTVVSVQVVHNLQLGGGLLPAWTFPIQSTASMIVSR
jgi:Flp pilus assembly protein TadG